MIANTTDHLQALRKGAADVLERHKRQYWRNVGPVCMHCSTMHTATANGHSYVRDESELVDWPCDAYLAARDLREAVEALNMVTIYDNWERADYVKTALMVERANYVLTAIAERWEASDD